MFEAFAEVPAYPLVFPVFWGAFAIFLLVVMRHVRVLQAVHAPGPRGLSQTGRRIGGVLRYAIVQTRMFREGRVGVMHLGLFLGSTILLAGNINMVTGGLPQAVISYPFDGLIWAFLVAVQQVVAMAALLGVVYAAYRRLVVRPA